MKRVSESKQTQRSKRGLADWVMHKSVGRGMDVYTWAGSAVGVAGVLLSL